MKRVSVVENSRDYAIVLNLASPRQIDGRNRLRHAPGNTDDPWEERLERMNEVDETNRWRFEGPDSRVSGFRIVFQNLFSTEPAKVNCKVRMIRELLHRMPLDYVNKEK